MKARILVIDDDDFILKLVSVTLSQAGHQVFTVSDGAEALQKAADIQPDLIILDVRMPGLDGYEVCRTLRNRPGFAHLPIMMLTANDTLEQKLKGFEAGADDYMIKPFQPAELEARMQVLLRRRGMVSQDQVTAIESQVIAVFSLRGGVGVSTLAVNLALGLVQAWELPTTLVDMSFTCGQDALMLNLPLHNTWFDLTDIPLKELDRNMVTQVLLSYSTDLSLLAAPSTPEQGDTVESGLVAAVLQLLMECNHYLVLDLPHDFYERTLLGLDIAHRIVTVMSPEIASVYATKRALEVFDNLGYDRNKIHLVLNQMFERHGIPRQAIEDALGRSVDFVIPSASKQLVDAINRGVPVIEKAPDSRLGAVLKDMAFDLSKEEHRSRQPVESATAWEHITRQLQQQLPE